MQYTFKHKIAFLSVENELLGRNTIRGYLHDIDKLILYPILGVKVSHNLHIKYSKHHIKNVKTKCDKIQMIIDWECARYTKPDKPLSAIEFINKYIKENKTELLNIAKDLGLK